MIGSSGNKQLVVEGRCVCILNQISATLLVIAVDRHSNGWSRPQFKQLPRSYLGVDCQCPKGRNSLGALKLEEADELRWATNAATLGIDPIKPFLLLSRQQVPCVSGIDNRDPVVEVLRGFIVGPIQLVFETTGSHPFIRSIDVDGIDTIEGEN